MIEHMTSCGDWAEKGVRDESMVAATGINRTAGEGYRAALSGKRWLDES